MFSVPFAFILSLLISLYLIPIFSRKARAVGLVDNPDKLRKLHEQPIPMVGGLAIFCSVTTVVFSICVFWSLYPSILSRIDGKLVSMLGYPRDFLAFRKISSYDIFQYVGLFSGSLMLVLVGLLDDRFGIRGRQKLFGQFLATTVLILFGFKFEQLTALGISVPLQTFSIFFVYAWVIASINSVNLLDGADGIAATIGIIMSFAMAVMLLYQGRVFDGIAAISIAGALIGFLRFNFPPAKVYLGDTGSMLIGFLLSALAIRSMFKQNSFYAFLAPVALLSIPFIDTGAAIIRRRLTGRSIFAVDRGHLHHTLMKKGYSPRVSLIWVALLSTMSAAGGTLALIFGQAEIAAVAIFFVIAVMIVSRIFGVAEYELIMNRAYGFARSLFRISRNPSDLREPQLQSSVHVQGNRQWDICWQQFCEFSDEHQLNKLTLDINAPWLHESFHATVRSREKVREASDIWKSVVPLLVDGRVFGSVEIKCSKDSQFTHHETILALMALTTDLEQEILTPADSSVAPAAESPVHQ
ncbi:undecaprenyl/decaprenyl-phosphate alpha-N-acetylglucosaminyl 1-phosphate transferase [bacterium]|nr:undecaprenyl/decaprenyl-phosphate alpha-N-acetylglucosaminyl 1-phosphate transferase [bacterium]